MFAGKKSAQIREILISESAWEEMTCLFAPSLNLQNYGPRLPRPYADTVKGSQYNNMKELRVQYAGRPIRALFAFDPERQAIVLCAGNKSNDKAFYEKLIRIADDEFTRHLTSLETAK